MTGLVDSFIIYTANPPLFWLVKGYEHPEGSVVAVPYRTPWGTRLDPAGYRRLAPIIQGRIRFLPCMGREAPVVEVREIVWVPDPSAALKLSRLPSRIASLLEALDPEWAGLTGSRLLGAEVGVSDYDILVYPRDAASAVDALLRFWRRGLSEPCTRRGGRSSPLDACAGGTGYTIRMLRTLEPLPCRGVRPFLGWWSGFLEIVDAGVESFLVPARYRARALGLGEIVLETWRTRFQALPKGCYQARIELFLEGDSILGTPDLGGMLSWAPGGCQ